MRPSARTSSGPRIPNSITHRRYSRPRQAARPTSSGGFGAQGWRSAVDSACARAAPAGYRGAGELPAGGPIVAVADLGTPTTVRRRRRRAARAGHALVRRLDAAAYVSPPTPASRAPSCPAAPALTRAPNRSQRRQGMSCGGRRFAPRSRAPWPSPWTHPPPAARCRRPRHVVPNPGAPIAGLMGPMSGGCVPDSSLPAAGP